MYCYPGGNEASCGCVFLVADDGTTEHAAVHCRVPSSVTEASGEMDASSKEDPIVKVFGCQSSGDNTHLRQPKDSILSRHSQRAQDLRQAREARDPKYRSPDHLRQARQKANVAKVVRPQLVPGWPPRPPPPPCRDAAIQLVLTVATPLALPRQESPLVTVVMPTPALLPAQHEPSSSTTITTFTITTQRLLERPPEAVGPVLIDGLEHEQHATRLEDGRAHGGRHAAAPRALARPPRRRRRGRRWQQHEEAVEHPHGGPEGEDGRDVVRHVPDRVAQEHARHALQGGPGGGRGPGPGPGPGLVRSGHGCCCCC